MKTIDGRKAEIISSKRRFTTYRAFANRHGYPDAAALHDEDDTRLRPQNGDIVTLLTSGPHEAFDDTLWIVEAANGERHIYNEKGLRILDEKITVLPDAELGGVEREYTEVKRKARVGERVKYVWPGQKPEVYTVANVSDNGDVDVERCDNDDNIDGLTFEAYVVLSPTDVIRLEGKRFRMVERKAAVGERVIITNGNKAYKTGEIITVHPDARITDEGVSFLDGYRGTYGAGKYAVLEPLDDAATPAQLAKQIEGLAAVTDGLTEAVGKLTLKVAELERKFSAPVIETLREPKVGDRVTIVNGSRSNIGLHSDFTTGHCGIIEEICVGTEVDGYNFLVNIPKTGALRWCARDAFVFADDMPKPQPEHKAISAARELTRDDVIERAKADVAKLERTNRVMCVPTLNGEIMSFYPRKTDGVKYVVNREKRTVVALIHWLGDNEAVWARGIAKCAPGDVFSDEIGKAIALRRALGLAVPSEYFGTDIVG